MGQGLQEKGINCATGEVVVEVSPELFRPAEVDILIGSATKAKELLKWTPETNVEELVRLMVQADFQTVVQGAVLVNQI
jgi:GDPmannose 4,6-dehydratase